MSKSKYSLDDVNSMIASLDAGMSSAALGIQWGCTTNHISALCAGRKGPFKGKTKSRATKGRAQANRDKILLLVAKGLNDAEIAAKLKLSKTYAASLRRGMPKPDAKPPIDHRWGGEKEANWDHDLSKKWMGLWSEIHISA